MPCVILFNSVRCFCYSSMYVAGLKSCGSYHIFKFDISSLIFAMRRFAERPRRGGVTASHPRAAGFLFRPGHCLFSLAVFWALPQSQAMTATFSILSNPSHHWTLHSLSYWNLGQPREDSDLSEFINSVCTVQRRVCVSERLVGLMLCCEVIAVNAEECTIRTAALSVCVFSFCYRAHICNYCTLNW